MASAVAFMKGEPQLCIRWMQTSAAVPNRKKTQLWATTFEEGSQVFLGAIPPKL